MANNSYTNYLDSTNTLFPQQRRVNLQGPRTHTSHRVPSFLAPSTRKGKMAFTGSILIDEEGVSYCPISSYAYDPIREKKLELAEQDIKSLKEENRIIKKDSNSFNEMFTILGATNPTIAEKMRKKRETTTTRGEGTSGISNYFVSRLFDMNSH
ncbi:unnamed protein product [Arabis nemorensis]|uniref:Uncharacterized protein n=1 Tax=Arabis nemorensis TaxID=586526 RepID=A0A565C8V8_9BRAS|nr:unnamed protein product [Arabis nemorensis]